MLRRVGFFFFQAEDGIRDIGVTGVQTCALPIFEQWLELAATVLAEAAGNVSVVTAPRTATARLRHFELIALQPRLGLLILVTADSSVRQVMVHWPEEVEQDALSRLADALVRSEERRVGK